MPLRKYGVLAGKPIGHLRNADDDHYQILVKADNTLFRIAVNVKSSAPKAPSTLLYQTKTQLPAALTDQLQALQPGFKRLPSKPGGLAIDFLRSGIVEPRKMKIVPPDEPGADNDLKDFLEGLVTDAMAEEGSVIYAMGERWGPETGKKDQYFKFVPGNGIHDIHMNQGNDGKYRKDNGTYQDGCVIVMRPGNKWRGIFLAFQSQSLDTDDDGNPRAAAVEPPQSSSSKRKRSPARPAASRKEEKKPKPRKSRKRKSKHH